ncbi:MAG: hypothetical protein SPF90_06150 [Bacteroidaceae bacterium]|nr:hypothetical protein [Bacteroidaceae bacterium]
MRKLLFMLLALILIGCKTKEKVTERMTDTAHVTGDVTQTSSTSSDSQSQAMATEQTTQTIWTDSLVEKTLERIVTDSSGRVLLHEAERTTERYKGSGKSLIQQQQNRHEKSEVNGHGTITETSDSTYNGGTLNEVTVVKKKPSRWLWYAGIAVIFITYGYIIIKVTRR